MEGELQLNICSLSLHTGQMATVQVARLGRGSTDVGFGVVQPFLFSTKKKQVLLKPQMSRMWYQSSPLTNGKEIKKELFSTMSTNITCVSVDVQLVRLSCHFPIFKICCNYLKEKKLLPTVKSNELIKVMP